MPADAAENDSTSNYASLTPADSHVQLRQLYATDWYKAFRKFSKQIGDAFNFQKIWTFYLLKILH